MNITVEVDPAAWAEEYGIPRGEVRADGAGPDARWRAEAATRPGTAVYDPRRWPRGGDRPPDDRPPPRPTQPPRPNPTNPDAPPRPRASSRSRYRARARAANVAWNVTALVTLAAVVVLCLASIRGPGW